MSKQSRRIDWIPRFETGTVFGTESFFDLEPQAGKRGKIPIESMVGVTGFEPATPTSRTQKTQKKDGDWPSASGICAILLL
jgi:hypothetical protein